MLDSEAKGLTGLSSSMQQAIVEAAYEGRKQWKVRTRLHDEARAMVDAGILAHADFSSRSIEVKFNTVWIESLRYAVPMSAEMSVERGQWYWSLLSSEMRETLCRVVLIDCQDEFVPNDDLRAEIMLLEARDMLDIDVFEEVEDAYVLGDDLLNYILDRATR